jgi:hypothetical protein
VILTRIRGYGYLRREGEGVKCYCAGTMGVRGIEKGPKGPFSISVLVEVGRSPPHIPNLLEECHDLIDYGLEGASGILSGFDEIATLLDVLIE